MKEEKIINKLNIAGRQIGKEGANELKDILIKNRSIMSLDLTCNDLRQWGTESIAIALEKNTTLKFLNLCTLNI